MSAVELFLRMLQMLLGLGLMMAAAIYAFARLAERFFDWYDGRKVTP